MQEGKKRMVLGKHDTVGRTAKLQRIIMMVMAVDDSSIDSDGNFHNDDSIMTVEAVMMIPTSCVHVTGVKCTICQSLVKAGIQ